METPIDGSSQPENFSPIVTPAVDRHRGWQLPKMDRDGSPGGHPPEHAPFRHHQRRAMDWPWIAYGSRHAIFHWIQSGFTGLHANTRSLRHYGRPGRPRRRPRPGLRSPPRAVRPQASRATQAAPGGLDKQAARGREAGRYDSLNPTSSCLTQVDRRRGAPAPPGCPHSGPPPKHPRRRRHGSAPGGATAARPTVAPAAPQPGRRRPGVPQRVCVGIRLSLAHGVVSVARSPRDRPSRPVDHTLSTRSLDHGIVRLPKRLVPDEDPPTAVQVDACRRPGARIAAHFGKFRCGTGSRNYAPQY